MAVALWVLVLGAFTGFGLVFWGVVQVANGLLTLSEQGAEVAAALTTTGTPGWYDDLYRRLSEVEATVDSLPAKWEEFERQGVRRENRIRAVVSRARQELADSGYEDPGLEAEAGELRRIHGDGGDEGGLHPLPANVERAQNAAPDDAGLPPGIEPWEVETWRRKYGSN